MVCRKYDWKGFDDKKCDFCFSEKNFMINILEYYLIVKSKFDVKIMLVFDDNFERRIMKNDEDWFIIKKLGYWFNYLLIFWMRQFMGYRIKEININYVRYY